MRYSEWKKSLGEDRPEWFKDWTIDRENQYERAVLGMMWDALEACREELASEAVMEKIRAENVIERIRESAHFLVMRGSREEENRGISPNNERKRTDDKRKLNELLNAIEASGQKDHSWCKYERTIARYIAETGDKVWILSKQWEYSKILKKEHDPKPFSKRYDYIENLMGDKNILVQPISNIPYCAIVYLKGMSPDISQEIHKTVDSGYRKLIVDFTCHYPQTESYVKLWINIRKRDCHLIGINVPDGFRAAFDIAFKLFLYVDNEEEAKKLMEMLP